MWAQPIHARLASYASPEKVREHNVQEQIKEDIAELEDLLLSFRRQHNALSPISRLPFELLSRIFLTAASLKRHRGIYSRHPSIAVSKVCHHWREIALADPSLWANIPLEMSRYDMCLFIDRSYPGPVRLQVYSPEQLEKLPSAKYFVGRLEVMNIICEERNSPLDSDDEYYTDAEILERFMREVLMLPAPLLQSLTINAEIGHRRPIVLPAHLFDDDAPVLRSISLHNACLDWPSASFPTLETLELFNAQLPSLEEFSSFLALCRELKTLRICGEMAFKRKESQTEPSDQMQIQAIDLPNLTTLEYDTGYGYDVCLDLLTAISMPSTCRICITSRVYTILDPLEIDGSQSFLSLLSAHLRKSISSSVWSIEVFRMIEFKIKIWSTPVAYDPVNYSIPEEKPFVELALAASFRDLGTCLRHCSLSLSLSGARFIDFVIQDRDTELSRRDIYDILLPCTSLERLNMVFYVNPEAKTDSFSIISAILDSKAKAIDSTMMGQSPFLTNLVILDVHLCQVQDSKRSNSAKASETPECLHVLHTFPPVPRAQHSVRQSQSNLDTDLSLDRPGGIGRTGPSTSSRCLGSPPAQCRQVDLRLASTLLQSIGMG